MGTILASAIIDRVEALLEDSSNGWWSAAFHLASLNEAQRKIVILKPDTNTVLASLQLVAGVKQTIPVDGIMLESLRMNMPSSGATRGTPITLVDRAILDAVLPSWTLATPSPTVVHYMYDLKSPTVFYVYPPQPSSSMGYVEEEYAQLPANIASTVAITLDDSLEEAIKHFMMFKAYESKKPQLATGYWSMFLSDLGLTEQREEADDPNVKAEKGGTK